MAEMAKLMDSVLSGDVAALGVLGDAASEEGVMFGFEIGKSYAIHTPQWGYIGAVSKIDGITITFGLGCQVHDWGDFPKAISSGKLSKSAEISPLPNGFTLTIHWIGVVIPWPHPIPLKRTHAEME